MVNMSNYTWLLCTYNCHRNQTYSVHIYSVLRPRPAIPFLRRLCQFHIIVCNMYCRILGLCSPLIMKLKKQNKTKTEVSKCTCIVYTKAYYSTSVDNIVYYAIMIYCTVYLKLLMHKTKFRLSFICSNI